MATCAILQLGCVDYCDSIDIQLDSYTGLVNITLRTGKGVFSTAGDASTGTVTLDTSELNAFEWYEGYITDTSDNPISVTDGSDIFEKFTFKTENHVPI